MGGTPYVRLIYAALLYHWQGEFSLYGLWSECILHASHPERKLSGPCINDKEAVLLVCNCIHSDFQSAIHPVAHGSLLKTAYAVDFPTPYR